jgi:copper(I)-binding protein
LLIQVEQTEEPMKLTGMWKFVCAFLCVVPIVATAAGDFKISGAWAKEPAPGQAVVGVYFTILSSHGGQLLKISSPIAKSAELHSTKIVDGMMQMRPLAHLDVPPNHAVTLLPNHTHVMLLDLLKKLSVGDHIALVATFQDANKKKSVVKFKALVKSE